MKLINVIIRLYFQFGQRPPPRATYMGGLEPYYYRFISRCYYSAMKIVPRWWRWWWQWRWWCAAFSSNLTKMISFLEAWKLNLLVAKFGNRWKALKAENLKLSNLPTIVVPWWYTNLWRGVMCLRWWWWWWWWWWHAHFYTN